MDTARAWQLFAIGGALACVATGAAVLARPTQVPVPSIVLPTPVEVASAEPTGDRSDRVPSPRLGPSSTTEPVIVPPGDPVVGGVGPSTTDDASDDDDEDADDDDDGHEDVDDDDRVDDDDD